MLEDLIFVSLFEFQDPISYIFEKLYMDVAYDMHVQFDFLHIKNENFS